MNKPLVKLDSYFEELKVTLKEVFPEFSVGNIKHAANKISNEINRCHFDCYGLDIGRAAFDNNGYYHHFTVYTNKGIVYIRMRVD